MHEIISLTIGYLASILLACSLLAKNDIRFRWLSGSGNIIFIIYGFTIHAFPVLITNSILLCINTYSLIKLYRKDEHFELLEFELKDMIIRKFLKFYKKDIAHYFPKYTIDENKNEIHFVVLRDLVIANIFIAHLSENGTAYVNINYTVPRFRDFKVGRFIFDTEKQYLIRKGIKQIAYREVLNKDHEYFLKVMGFEKAMLPEGECYLKKLD